MFLVESAFMSDSHLFIKLQLIARLLQRSVMLLASERVTFPFPASFPSAAKMRITSGALENLKLVPLTSNHILQLIPYSRFVNQSGGIV